MFTAFTFKCPPGLRAAMLAFVLLCGPGGAAWAESADSRSVTQGDLRNMEGRIIGRVNERFDGVKERFDGTNRRINDTNERIGRLETRVEQMNLQTHADLRLIHTILYGILTAVVGGVLAFLGRSFFGSRFVASVVPLIVLATAVGMVASAAWNAETERTERASVSSYSISADGGEARTD